MQDKLLVCLNDRKTFIRKIRKDSVAVPSEILERKTSLISAKSHPSEWKIVKLKDYVFFQEGPGLRNWQFCNKGIKIINVKNIANNKLTLDNSKNFCSKEEVDKRSPIFCLRKMT